ncbi:MAG: S8 family serine peptidase [Paracholeplasma sp.]|nr:S8 family serine peptidase [Paracholeplasma sp.]MDY3195515.1 S8 family serine peptidase [Paracholeplasma sp.]
MRKSKFYSLMVLLLLTTFLFACEAKQVGIKPYQPDELMQMDYNAPKERHFDSDGNLLVTYDVAYKELFLSGQIEYDQTQILIKMPKAFDAKLTQEMKDAGLVSLEKSTSKDKTVWYQAKITDKLDVRTVMKNVRSLKGILVADYDYIYESEAVTYHDVLENERVQEQWHLSRYGIEDAWQFLEDKGIDKGGSSSVVVAVIDTGVDYTHPDLMQNMWINTKEIPNDGVDNDGNGYIDDVYGINVESNQYYDTSDPMDDHGHGTHVAGIIAADNNKEGVVGVAYNVKIMAIKAGQASGFFNQSSIARGVMYAYDMGADVINMSFGGSAISIEVQDALMHAYTRSVLVASAGNNGLPNEYVPGWITMPSYPAGLSYVVGVMSVNEFGFESSFTNWDVKGYNKVEYEVYAPGEQILSTLPGGKYASWSGTSMAAPVVSGIAALVRSMYPDRNMYPNKFIMGQLVSTSEEYAMCNNPMFHGLHNIPMIVDAYSALAVLPKPDINLYDYYIFDNEELSLENNGDGIIDAGETIDLALVLRNRWGMSKDTIVTIDSISDGGVANPHVEFLTNDINFQGVGTYSTKDTLKRVDNVVVGVDDPFRIKISKNAPNDYIIKINVYADYQNALDLDDLTHYGLPPQTAIYLTVRNGLILPNIIEEDMTLTKDNYYIIPNSMIIQAGATVTVEPGTNIQFWTDDPESPYADTSITYLRVDGRFLVKGTQEEPVKLFPSELMSQYRVEIIERNNGYVSLEYAEITNPYLVVSYISHSKLTQNYRNVLYYRSLYEGKIQLNTDRTMVNAGLVEDSIFYSLGGYSEWESAEVHGQFYRNIFIENQIRFYAQSTYYENVFLNNHTERSGGNYGSSFIINPHVQINRFNNAVYVPDNDTYYITVNSDYAFQYRDTVDYLNQYAKTLGGTLAMFETEEELLNYRRLVNNSGVLGLIKDYKTNTYKWANGKPYTLSLPIVDENSNGFPHVYFENDRFVERQNGHTFIIEVKANRYLDNIQVPNSNISIDLETSYQIEPFSTMKDADLSKLIYSIDDEGIATVDQNGLVKPVGYGQATVYISSPDYQRFTTVTINVVRKIDLFDFTVEAPNILNTGDEYQLSPILIPSNTTQGNLVYESSDPAVITVNSAGRLIALNAGTSTIKVKSLSLNKTLEFTVKVETAVESINFVESIYITTLDSINDDLQFEVKPLEANGVNVKFESSNPSVAYINELGELVKLKEGTTTIRATVPNTNLFDELTISVQDAVVVSKPVQMETYNNVAYFILNEAGEIYIIGKDRIVPEKVIFPENLGKIKSFSIYSDRMYVVAEDMTVRQYYIGDYVYNNNPLQTNTDYDLSQLTNVTRVITSHGSAMFLKTDGSVWGVGYNNYGELGDNSINTHRSKPVQSLIENVVDIATDGYSTFYLLNNADVYMAGSNVYHKVPKHIYSNAVKIYGNRDYGYVNVVTSNRIYFYNYSDYPNNEQNILSSNMFIRHSDSIYIQNGEVYAKGSNQYGKLGIGSNQDIWEYRKVLGLKNIEKFFVFDQNTFYVTTDGQLYASGSNQYGQLVDFTTTNSNVAKKIVFGVSKSDLTIDIESTNVEGSSLYDDRITIDFNDAISLLSESAYISLKDTSNNSLSIRKTVVLDKLMIEPFTPLEVGKVYILTLPDKSIGTKFGSVLPNEEYSFIYFGKQVEIELVNQSVTSSTLLEVGEHTFEFTYSYAKQGALFDQIAINDSLGNPLTITKRLVDNVLSITTTLTNDTYELIIPSGALSDNLSNHNDALSVSLHVSNNIEVLSQSHLNNRRYEQDDSIVFTFNQAIESTRFNDIKLYTLSNEVVNAEITLVDQVLTINPVDSLTAGMKYQLIIPSNALKDSFDQVNQAIEVNFGIYEPIKLERIGSGDHPLLLTQKLKLVYNYAVVSTNYNQIKVLNALGEEVSVIKQLNNGILEIQPVIPYKENQTYTLQMPENALVDEKGVANTPYEFTFNTVDQLDRIVYDSDYILGMYNKWVKTGDAGTFKFNAILNPFTDTNIQRWFRFNAGTASEEKYFTNYYGISNNYLGTTDMEMINKMILDFDDYQQLINIIEGVILEEAPETAFPFVTNVKVFNQFGEETSTVGNETITVEIKFNRDMDQTIPLDVRFGSSLPYAEYQIPGNYVDARTWRATYTLTTIIENGNQYFNITNGHILGNPWFSLQRDVKRFGFEIDTTEAQALTMSGVATSDGIELSWEQDDFDTLAGYNVYRSEAEDGYYNKLNTTVIPHDVKSFFDPNVMPGIIYYYNFTVVKTDLTESFPSGKISIMSLDTMDPSLHHSPVFETFLNQTLVISAMANDNVRISSVKLYFRTTGDEAYQLIEMTKDLNNKYSAVVGANHINSLGFEYYIVASDGLNETYRASASSPYQVLVKSTIDTNALGDVNGDGIITTLDALMMLQAINDIINLNSEQFRRADLNQNDRLETQEVLRILQYVSGKVKVIVG